MLMHLHFLLQDIITEKSIMAKEMLQALITVALVTTLMSTVTYYGCFDTVLTELGDDHYAEVHPESWRRYIPLQLRMPLNTAVNIGYVVVGAFYCARISVAVKQNLLKQDDAFMFYVFNFMAAFYGVIQTLRILIQTHKLPSWISGILCLSSCGFISGATKSRPNSTTHMQ